MDGMGSCRDAGIIFPLASPQESSDIPRRSNKFKSILHFDSTIVMKWITFFCLCLQQFKIQRRKWIARFESHVSSLSQYVRSIHFLQFLKEKCLKLGWQTFRGHNRWHLVDKRGDISWTLLATSRGHFCPRNVLFLGEFSWTFLWWHFMDTISVNSCGLLSSNKLTQT